MTMASSDDENENTPIPPMLMEDAEATLYKYRDFANVPEDPTDTADQNQSQSNRSLESSIRVQKFPVKLYAILAQKEFSDIISWMPHGRSWKVLKPNLFESLVMPLFFEYSNYHSFNRLVNAWSFRRISSGPDRGSYYHELFLRGKPHLQKYMRRLPKTHKKLPMKKQDEPDFYKLDKASPLPDLEESNSLGPNMFSLRRPAIGIPGGVATMNAAQLAGMTGIQGMPGVQTGMSTSGMQGVSGVQGMPGVPGMPPMPGSMPGTAGLLAANKEGLAALQGIGSLGGPSSAFGGSGYGNGANGYGSGAASMMGFGAPGAVPSQAGSNVGALGQTPTGPTSAPGVGLGGAPGPAPGVMGNASHGAAMGVGAPVASNLNPAESQLYHSQLQRLRHLQHLQMFQRQIGGSSIPGQDDLARLQAEHALGLR